MGLVNSKSPLERRNTVARRSQRRTLHNFKPKIDQLEKRVKKFKGIIEDVSYVNLQREITELKSDLTRRARDLQPQVRSLYENVYKRLCETEEALKRKLEENQQKHEGKIDQNHQEVMSDVTTTIDNETVAQIHQESPEELHTKPNVELKVVQLQLNNHDEQSTKSLKEVRIVSPTEKRKSILKVGVPVMPGAFMAAKHQQETTEKQISDLVESLRKIELGINDFVGQVNGKQYNRIKDELHQRLQLLNTLTPDDDYTLEKMKTCRAYIDSCLNFLNEKAIKTVVDEESYSDDDEYNEVFDNNNVPMNKVEDNFKLQKLLKNTAV
ncbi:hypothetical protein ABEB36_010129 [Hypothenemus hampei]|uniref:Uncharacterized protein n=1 Tax=Hypothenemus hampei TaxID=57062 RepID=A0ABD1EIR4_HYPHA